MCYHYSLKATKREIEKLYQQENSTSLKSWTPAIYRSAFEDAMMPVVTSSGIQMFTWGLVPNWSKEKKLKFNTAIARSEEVFIKPSWKEPIFSQRCIVPATGFFEWRHEGKTKYPYHIYMDEFKIMSLAGIWDVWQDPISGSMYFTYSILTEPADKFMSKIHNIKKRMPLILYSNQIETWLDDASSQTQIKSIIDNSKHHNFSSTTLKQGFYKQKEEEILTAWEYPELDIIDLF